MFYVGTTGCPLYTKGPNMVSGSLMHSLGITELTKVVVSPPPSLKTVEYNVLNVAELHT
jgi:hypothetical protein